MMANDRILSFLGLATKAGKVVSGEFSVEKAVKSMHAKLVIVAEDASDNTKKLFSDKCKFYHVPYVVYGNKESLGLATGKMFRATVAITDDGFAKSLLEKFK